MTELREKLIDHPFFNGLDGQHIEFLIGCAGEAECAARELLFREGDEADKFYLILEGKFSIEMFTPERGSLGIQTIAAGDVLGWSWLADPPKWHFDLRALEPTRMIAFDAQKIRAGCERDVALGYALLSRFLNIVVERLQATRMQLLDLYHVHS